MSLLSSIEIQHDVHYAGLKQFIVNATGLVYFQDKDPDLCHRLERRFNALNISDCKTYFDRLTKSVDATAEFDRLVVELTIGETYFFRHTEQFEALKSTIFPDIIARNQSTKRLRVWCAGCSIGAEPYSIAIQLAEEFGLQLEGWDVKVTGTDINREFIARAERGRFDEWAFRTTDAEFRRKHFTQDEKSWTIKPHIKRWVDFQYHNLLATAHPPLLSGVGALDLVICRNVMIYFDSSIVSKIIPNFEQALGEGGWLVIGHAEQAHGATQLKLIQLPKVTVYQKSLEPTPATVFPMSFELKPTPVLAPVSIPAAESNVSHFAPAVPDLTGAIAYLRKLADAAQFELALTECSKLLARDPKNAVVYFYKALISQQLGHNQDVEASLNQAIKLDPNFIMPHYYLGLHYERRGDGARTVRCFKGALALLVNLRGTELLAEADGISADELRKVISTHLEAA